MERKKVNLASLKFMKHNGLVKKQVRELLLQKDYTRLVDLCTKHKPFWRELKFSLYDIDRRIKWPACQVPWIPIKQPEAVATTFMSTAAIRTLFWSMND